MGKKNQNRRYTANRSLKERDSQEAGRKITGRFRDSRESSNDRNHNEKSGYYGQKRDSYKRTEEGSQRRDSYKRTEEGGQRRDSFRRTEESGQKRDAYKNTEYSKKNMLTETI